MTTNKKIIRFNFGEVTTYNENTLLVTYNNHIEITSEVLVEVDKARRKLLGSQPYNLVVDASAEFVTMSHKAKLMHSKSTYNNEGRLKDAIVLNGMGPKLEAALYKSSMNPQAETKFFENLQEALDWIDEK